jgi:hypothetical protein
MKCTVFLEAPPRRRAVLAALREWQAGAPQANGSLNPSQRRCTGDGAVRGADDDRFGSRAVVRCAAAHVRCTFNCGSTFGPAADPCAAARGKCVLKAGARSAAGRADLCSASAALSRARPSTAKRASPSFVIRRHRFAPALPSERNGSLQRRHAIEPRLASFQLGGKRQQGRLLAVAARKMHAHRQAIRGSM